MQGGEAVYTLYMQDCQVQHELTGTDFGYRVALLIDPHGHPSNVRQSDVPLASWPLEGGGLDAAIPSKRLDWDAWWRRVRTAGTA